MIEEKLEDMAILQLPDGARYYVPKEQLVVTKDTNGNFTYPVIDIDKLKKVENGIQ